MQRARQESNGTYFYFCPQISAAKLSQLWTLMQGLHILDRPTSFKSAVPGQGTADNMGGFTMGRWNFCRIGNACAGTV